MTVLLDLNVLLDALLGREPWRAEADAIWDANREGRIGGRVSAAALPTLFYVIRKQVKQATLDPVYEKNVRHGHISFLYI
jgi:predicted nucleic acid-binding protein